MRPLIVVTVLVTLLPCWGSAAPADEPPGLLDHETFMHMESIGGTDISPDGRLVMFSRRRVDQDTDRFASNLWMVDAEGERVRELTHGPYRDSAPTWSPDGSRIAFISDRDGSSQIHRIWIDTREVAPLTHVERSPGDIRWSPDGKRIAFTMFVPDPEPALKVKLPAKPEGASRAKGAIVVDRLSWQRDGSGYMPPGQTQVFTIDAVVGGTERQVTDGEYSHRDPQWSADGGSLYVTAIREPDWEYLRGDTEIYAVDLETREITALTDRDGPDRGPRVSPDGSLIAYTGYDQQDFTSHLSSLSLMRADGSDKRVWATDLP
ncbi:MAG: TolB family protein, partial [Planctomycetota bacterium]